MTFIQQTFPRLLYAECRSYGWIKHHPTPQGTDPWIASAILETDSVPGEPGRRACGVRMADELLDAAWRREHVIT